VYDSAAKTRRPGRTGSWRRSVVRSTAIGFPVHEPKAIEPRQRYVLDRSCTPPWRTSRFECTLHRRRGVPGRAMPDREDRRVAHGGVDLVRGPAGDRRGCEGALSAGRWREIRDSVDVLRVEILGRPVQPREALVDCDVAAPQLRNLKFDPSARAKGRRGRGAGL